MCSKQKRKAGHGHKKGHAPRAQEEHSSMGISRPHTEVLRTRTYFSAANTLPRNRASRGHLNLSVQYTPYTHCTTYCEQQIGKMPRQKHIILIVLAQLMCTLAIDNGRGLKPPMGWRSWNLFGADVSQSLMMQVRQRIVNRKQSSLCTCYIAIPLSRTTVTLNSFMSALLAFLRSWTAW